MEKELFVPAKWRFYAIPQMPSTSMAGIRTGTYSEGCFSTSFIRSSSQATAAKRLLYLCTITFSSIKI
jgi:hypothetical protein